MEYKIIIDGRIIDSWEFERLPPEYMPGVALLLAMLPEGYETGKNYTLEGVGYIYRCRFSEAFEIEFDHDFLRRLEDANNS